MHRSITMRELQRMSANVIRSLPGPTAIKSGSETVAILTPFKKPDPEALKAVLHRIEEHQAKLSPEIRLELQRMVGEIED